MGLDQSRPLNEWGCEEVANETAKLGHQYSAYCDTIIENSVDGYLLASLSPSEIPETLDDLDIQNRLHRRVIEKKLLALIKAGSRSSASQPSPATTKYLVPKEGSVSCSSVADSRDEETSRTEDYDDSDKTEPLSPEDEERKRIIDFMAAAQEEQMKERDALVARESALTSQIQIQRLCIQPRTA